MPLNMIDAWLPDEILDAAAQQYSRAFLLAKRVAIDSHCNEDDARECGKAVAERYIDRWFEAIPVLSVCLGCKDAYIFEFDKEYCDECVASVQTET